MSKLRDVLLAVVVATVCMFASAPQSKAASYYVDYSSGLDSNVGTSPSSAWKHCPGDAAATAVPASATLMPGDTVWFKQGVNYVLTSPSTYAGNQVTAGIQLYWSGSKSAPITYASTSAWGVTTNRAVFTDNYAQGFGYAVFWNHYGESNIVFNNLEFGPLGGSNSLPSNTGSNVNGVPPNPGWGIFFDECIVSNVTVENCYFHNIGYWQNQEPLNSNSIQGTGRDGESSAGIAVAGSGAGLNGLTITNCEFTKVCNAVDIGYQALSYNLTIAGCDFHDYTVWSIDIAGQGGGSGVSINNVFIHGNTFHDWDWSYAPYYWAAYGDPPHHDGIYLRPASEGAGSNIDIYANVFYETHTNASATAAIWAASSSANIYNNLIVNCSSLASGDYGGTEPINCSAGAGTPNNAVMRVLNNTIIINTTADLDGGASTEALHLGCDGSETWPANNPLLVENNIFYDFRTSSYGDALVDTDPITVGTTVWTFNYNDYSTVLASFFQISGLGESLNLAGLRIAGWEANGQASNPLFVSLPYGSGTSSGQNNYGILSNSPCIGAGANLGSLNLPGLNADIQGNPRPVSGPWDIGAYEYNTNNVTGIPGPVAAFGATPTNGTAPLTVTFTDTSTGSITSRAWQFGDGNITNTMATTVVYQYAAPGTDTVQLIVSGPGGSSTNVQASLITVGSAVSTNSVPPPVAAFSAAPTGGTAPLTVTFTDASTGSISNRTWQFGDGNVMNTTATTVIYQYTAPGTDTVQLIVSGPGGSIQTCRRT